MLVSNVESGEPDDAYKMVSGLPHFVFHLNNMLMCSCREKENRNAVV